MTAIPAWATIGRKVVCITDFWSSRGIDGPAKREIVTISAIYINAGEQPCLRFTEHYGWLDDDMGMRHGYAPRCFRPVITRTQEQDVRAIRALIREKETM